MASRDQQPSSSRRTRRRTPEADAIKSKSPSIPVIVAIILGMAVLGGVAYFIFRSGSGMTQSQARPISTLSASDFHSLVFSPEDTDTVYFGHHSGVMTSHDGGRTWQPWVNERNWDAMGLAFSASSPITLYAAGHDIFFKSTDGQNWERVRHNLPGTDIHGFAVDPGDPKLLYAFVVGSGLNQSNDGGSTWRVVNSDFIQGHLALAVVPGTPKTLLVGTMQSGLLRSSDGGATLRKVEQSSLGNSIMALAASPRQPGLVWASSGSGFFKSEDAGSTWTGLDLDVQAMAIAISPNDSNVILVVDNKGRVYRSQDGGISWGG